MTRIALIVAVLCLAVSLAFCSSPKETAVPSFERHLQARDALTLFFDDMEGGTNGWTTVDNSPAMTTKFHLDSFLSYQGSYSWWCGETNPAFSGGSGYGNSWDQRLDIPATDVSGATYPILTYAYRHSSEPEYDYTYVQAKSGGEYVSLNDGYDGTSSWQDLGAYGFSLTGYDNPVEARFRFVSDGMWSDEDGIWDSDGGAFHCDNVKIFDYLSGYVYFYDDCESGGLCVPSIPPPAGDWWHIIDRACPAYSGSHSWWCGDDADTSHLPGCLNNSLISPAIDISGVESCTIRLAAHLEIPTVDSDYVGFTASTDGGSNWVLLATYWGAFPECYGWISMLLEDGFSLDDYGLLPADSLLFRITMHTTDNGCGGSPAGGAGVMIDDVIVTSWIPPRTWHVPGDAPTIQAAIDSARAGENVLVSAGTYSASVRQESFPIVMKSGVTLASEAGADSTILDAEGTASVLVFTDIPPGTTLSGFTLTGGAATCGGGVYCSGSAPSIESCVFVGNTATTGGGLYCDAGSGPTLVNCTFVDNAADEGVGVASAENSYPDLLRCLIAFGGPGAAVSCSGGGTVSTASCDVYGNAGGDWVGCIAGQSGTGGNISEPPGFCDREASDFGLRSASPCVLGGGLYMGALGVSCPSMTWEVPTDAPTIQAAIDSARVYDTVSVGCGTYYEHDIVMRRGVSVIGAGEADCVVIDAGGFGRIIDCDDLTELTEISNLTLTGGYAGHGAGMRFVGSSPTVTGCVIAGNTAGVSGGGAFCSDGSQPHFDECTFHDNAAPDATVSAETSSAPTLAHSIVAFASAGTAVSCDGTSGATLTYCDLYGNAGGDWTGCIAGQSGTGGNISEVPGFCDEQAGDLGLCSGSPCVLGGGIFIGALGMGCPSVTWGVPADAATIQTAIDLARAYDTVSIDCGTYYEHGIVVRPGVSIESSSGEADCVTIDAEELGRVFECDGVSDLTSISGITLTGGYSDYGAGMRLVASSPDVSKCIIAGNEATASGGGALCSDGSSPSFTNCTFTANSAPDATVSSQTSSWPVLANSIIAFGSAGSAVSCDGGSSTALSCSDVYGNAGGDWTGCIAGYAGMSGNIWADPLFANAPGGDFHLVPASPCLEPEPCGLMGALGLDVDPEPGILHVADTPSDEGGFVTVTWTRSSHESSPDPPSIATYDLYRRQQSRLDGWDLMDSIPAGGDWIYETTVATLCDSTPQQGICWSTFFVKATTPLPSFYFDSQPDSGYSVDNLAPHRPRDLVAILTPGRVTLIWTANNEPDFHQYAVYRDTVPDVDLGAPLCYATEEHYEDYDFPASDTWWYVVTALDLTGNESEPSVTVSVVTDEIPPDAPENLNVYGDSTAVHLTWDESSEPDFFWYAVYKDTFRDFEPGTPLGYTGIPSFEDTDLSGASMWWYVVTAWDVSGNESEPSLPDSASMNWSGVPDHEPRFALRHALPNPFNPRTTIAYELPEACVADLRVYDVSGKLVRVLVDDLHRTEGLHEVPWDGRDDRGKQLPSGVYFYRLEAGGDVLMKRMVLLQ